MNNKIHAFSNTKSTSWSGGKTTELFISPQNSEFKQRNFDFRISSATIEVEQSDFTSLPDYNRLLAILEGELEISHEGKYSKKLVPFETDSFHGSWNTKSVGKVRDFNVIYSDSYNLDFTFRELDNELIIKKKSDFLFIFVLNDSFVCEGNHLNKYDLIEVNQAEIILEKGLQFFQIGLNVISK